VHQLFIATSLQLLLLVIQTFFFVGDEIFNPQKKKSAKIKCHLFRPKTAEISYRRNYRLYRYHVDTTFVEFYGIISAIPRYWKHLINICHNSIGKEQNIIFIGVKSIYKGLL
jgi:hypothetical protein